MRTLQALLALGFQASMTGDEPQSEAEYFERVVVHSGERPDWATVTAKMSEGPSPAELRAHAAVRRYDVETGGIVSGTFGPMLTDRATQSMLASTIQSIDLGIVSTPINFKAPSGFVGLDRAALVAISTEIAAHVQAAFNTEATVVAAIEAGTITTRAEIDAAAWPSNT